MPKAENMTWHKALLSLGAVALAVTTVYAQSRVVRSDQEVLIQLEHDWDDAFHRKDAKFIDTILAEEFIATYGDGSRGDRKKELSLATDFNQQVDSSTLDEFTVKIYGNTAVIWFSQHLLGPIQGRQVAVTYRYVDVFVMRDGRWQCVASQSTRVTPKPS
jgi:ketosteroid isomerase-like protein